VIRYGFLREAAMVFRRECAYEAALRLIAALPDDATVEDARRTARDMLDTAYPLLDPEAFYPKEEKPS